MRGKLLLMWLLKEKLKKIYSLSLCLLIGGLLWVGFMVILSFKFLEMFFKIN